MENIDLKQISQTYKKAIEAMKTPYTKVLAPEQQPKPPKFVEPPMVMRNYFGERDNGKS